MGRDPTVLGFVGSTADLLIEVVEGGFLLTERSGTYGVRKIILSNAEDLKKMLSAWLDTDTRRP